MSEFRFRDRFRDKTWTESLGVTVRRRENRDSLISLIEKYKFRLFQSVSEVHKPD